MSTAAISSNSFNQLQSYVHNRTSDLQQLKQALQSGNQAEAQQDVQSLVALGKQGPVPNGDAFLGPKREQAFEAVGGAVQAHDLQGARQAFGQLFHSFQHRPHGTPRPALPLNAPTSDPQPDTSVDLLA